MTARSVIYYELRLTGGESTVGKERDLRRAVTRVLFSILAGAILCSCQFPFLNPAHDNSRAIPTTIASPDSPQVSEYLVTSDSRSVSGGAMPQVFPRQAFFSQQIHRGPVQVLENAKKGGGVYTGGDDGLVFFAQVVKGTGNSKNRVLRVETVVSGKKPIHSLALSPDGRILAIGQISQVVLFDTARRVVVGNLSRIKGRITSMSWDPRGELLAIGRASGDIIVWRVRSKRGFALDDLRVLEFYLGGSAPVSAIRFHPSGGILFAAEDNGSITLWRLLRTEHEIGLRDDFAEIDDEQKSEDGERFAQLGVPVTDLWLTPDGSFLYATSRAGNLHSWRVRGLVSLGATKVGNGGEIFALSGKELPGSANGIARHLVFMSSRDQQLRIVCHAIRPPEQTIQPPPLSLELARSDVLPNPPSSLRLASDPATVWGGDQSGNLLLFDAESMLDSAVFSANLRRCIPR